MSTETRAGLESSGTDTTDASYTYHVEPPAQGGKRYARCEECGAELLCSLGGAEKLLHVEGCSLE